MASDFATRRIERRGSALSDRRPPKYLGRGKALDSSSRAQIRNLHSTRSLRNIVRRTRAFRIYVGFPELAVAHFEKENAGRDRLRLKARDRVFHFEQFVAHESVRYGPREEHADVRSAALCRKCFRKISTRMPRRVIVLRHTMMPFRSERYAYLPFRLRVKIFLAFRDVSFCFTTHRASQQR